MLDARPQLSRLLPAPLAAGAPRPLPAPLGSVRRGGSYFAGALSTGAKACILELPVYREVTGSEGST